MCWLTGWQSRKFIRQIIELEQLDSTLKNNFPRFLALHVSHDLVKTTQRSQMVSPTRRLFVHIPIKPFIFGIAPTVAAQTEAPKKHPC